VLTWCGQQKAQEAFLYWCCVPFTNKKMLMALQRAQAISRWAVTLEEGSLRLWSFIRFTSPLFSWYAPCSWWRVRFLVVPFPPCGPPLLGYLLAWTLVLAPCSFSLSLFWVLSFYEVWQDFITFELLNSTYEFESNSNSIELHSVQVTLCKFGRISSHLNSIYQFESNSNSIKLHSVQVTLCKFGRISSHLNFWTQHMNLNPIQIQSSCIQFKLHYASLAGFHHIWTFELNIWIWIQFKFN